MRSLGIFTCQFGAALSLAITANIVSHVYPPVAFLVTWACSGLASNIWRLISDFTSKEGGRP